MGDTTEVSFNLLNAGPPTSVRNLKISEIGTMQMTVTFETPEQTFLNVDEYQINYRLKDSNAVIDASTSTSNENGTTTIQDLDVTGTTAVVRSPEDLAGLQQKIENLKWNSNYQFFVRAVTLEANGPWAMVEGQTKQMFAPDGVRILVDKNRNIEINDKKVQFNMAV